VPVSLLSEWFDRVAARRACGLSELVAKPACAMMIPLLAEVEVVRRDVAEAQLRAAPK